MKKTFPSQKKLTTHSFFHQLIEEFVRENEGDRDATVKAIYAYITGLMDRDERNWAVSGKWIRTRVAAVVDDYVKH